MKRSSDSVWKASGHIAVALAGLLAACGSEKSLDAQRIKDPTECETCHPDHYREWSGSMHAYAPVDPVFLAMNARAQEETNGAIGTFCLDCHAPIAVREGLTTDGLNLDELPAEVKGVTCYFCHSINEVTGDANAAVELADDLVIRGGLPEPIENSAHASTYSPLHDRNDIRSSDLCGACHDVVTPAGVHLERTYAEWKETFFAHDNPRERQTCGACHMTGRRDEAAMGTGIERRVHSHAMPGVDIALTDFPEAATQRELVQRELDTTLVLQVCVLRVLDGVEVTLDLENLAAGHSFPSGATHDRRVWVELEAYLGPQLVYTSGLIAEGQSVRSATVSPPWVFGDRIFGEDGEEVHMFWEVASYEGEVLIGPAAVSPLDPDYVDTHRRRTYAIPTLADRVVARVRVRPFGLDIIDDLVESGHLEADIRAKVPTFTLGSTEVEWRAEDNLACVPEL